MPHEHVRDNLNVKDNGELVERFYEAFTRRDINAQLALFDPGIEWHAAESFIYASNRPYTGRDEMRVLLEHVYSEWDQFDAIPLEFVGAGDTVMTRGRYLGTFKATGLRIDCEFVHVFRVRNGKIVSIQTYTDTAQFRDTIQRVRLSESAACDTTS